MKNVEIRKRKGFITHEDIIRLTRLKVDIFPEFDQPKTSDNTAF